MLGGINSILWDFDGVILDSMSIRDWGFEKIFKEFPREQVAKLIKYHRANGGLSRYVKIRYFYEEVLGKEILENEVMKYANEFSKLMKKELTNPSNLIEDSVTFIKKNYLKYNFHIVSGSDQEELRFLCNELNLSKYFISIHGSPTAKKQLVNMVIDEHNYDRNNTCLIGDSINDFEASEFNGIAFYGYNNIALKDKGRFYIKEFKKFNYSDKKNC